MKTVGVLDAKTHLSELIEKVAKGDEVTITRHGRPVARLVPADSRAAEEQRRRERAVAGLLVLRKRYTLGGLRPKDLINEGRRR